jgi:hypothetical protein
MLWPGKCSPVWGGYLFKNEMVSKSYFFMLVFVLTGVRYCCWCAIPTIQSELCQVDARTYVSCNAWTLKDIPWKSKNNDCCSDTVRTLACLAGESSRSINGQAASVPTRVTCSNKQRTAHDMSLGVRCDVHLKLVRPLRKTRALVKWGHADVAACESQSITLADAVLQSRNDNVHCLEPADSRMHRIDASPGEELQNLAVERGDCRTNDARHEDRSVAPSNAEKALKDH